MSCRESISPLSSHIWPLLSWKLNLNIKTVNQNVSPRVVPCGFSLCTSEAGDWGYDSPAPNDSHLYPRHFASCRERVTRSVARPKPLAAGETAMIFMSKSSGESALENTSLLWAWKLSSLNFQISSSELTWACRRIPAIGANPGSRQDSTTFKWQIEGNLGSIYWLFEQSTWSRGSSASSLFITPLRTTPRGVSLSLRRASFFSLSFIYVDIRSQCPFQHQAPVCCQDGEVVVVHQILNHEIAILHCVRTLEYHVL